MWSVATDRVAWSVCLSVCLSITSMSPAKMAEPIQVLFGMWTWVGPRHYVVYRGYPMERILLMPKISAKRKRGHPQQRRQMRWVGLMQVRYR